MKTKMRKSVVTLMVAGMTVVGAAGAYAGTSLLRNGAFPGESVAIGTNAPETAPTAEEGTEVSYGDAQIREILEAFSAFEGFETAYAPTRMASGDAYRKAVATGDGVNLVFDHMLVNVSPRDYSYEYEGTTVTLSNGVQGKWYTPSDTPMLSFKADDRTVTISASDEALGKGEIERIAASVEKLS
ncbi:hypothetical protein [Cohnella cellulosilytica]|uniref:DUF4367 domain-containing protein n=1 Tax=Cohnella cellulosilytica TaxID=986710 RepID=A0ABW2FJE9_9BACL